MAGLRAQRQMCENRQYTVVVWGAGSFATCPSASLANCILVVAEEWKDRQLGSVCIQMVVSAGMQDICSWRLAPSSFLAKEALHKQIRKVDYAQAREFGVGTCMANPNLLVLNANANARKREWENKCSSGCSSGQ